MTSPMQKQDSTPRPAAVPPLDLSGLQAPADSPHSHCTEAEDARLQSSRRSANSEAPTSASHDEKAQSQPKSRTPSTEYFNIYSARYDQAWKTNTASLVDDSCLGPLSSHRSVTSAGSMGSWTSSSTYGRRRRSEIDDLRAQISELKNELTELKKTTSPTTSPEKPDQSSADQVPEPKSSSADAEVGLLEQPLSHGANEVAEESAVEDSSVRYTSRIAERRQNTSDVLKAHIPHQSSRSGLILFLRYALAISFAVFCSQPKFAYQSSSPWRFDLDVEICGQLGPGMTVIVADRGLSLECQSAGEEAAVKAQAEAEAAAKTKAEDEARIKAEKEAAAKKKKAEAEAAAKAQAEAAKAQAEAEAAAKSKAEEEARIKAEKESAAKKKKVEEEAAAKAKAKEEAAAKVQAAEEAAAKAKAAEEAAAKVKAVEEAAAKAKVAEEAAAKAKAAEEADGHLLEDGDDGAGAVEGLKTPNEVQQTQGNRPWTIALGSMMLTGALRWLHGFQSEPSLTIRHW